MSQGKPRKIAMKNNGQLMRGGEAAAVAASSSSSSSSSTREGRRRRDSSLMSPPPMMVQERVLGGLERASEEEEEEQQEEKQELVPGMMLRQPLDVVATIDAWTADWMVQEQVDKREAELVESWLSRMLSKVLKMEEGENVAEEQQQHSSLPLEGCGLRGAGLDRKRLMERGMPANHIDFVYRALYAHSAGFYETLHGGQGFKVDAEEMERLSVAFKLLMNLMQQGTTDAAAAAIIPALYSSPDDASKLDGNKQPTHHSCHSSSGYSSSSPFVVVLRQTTIVFAMVFFFFFSLFPFVGA
jgi:hypothetical protein